MFAEGIQREQWYKIVKESQEVNKCWSFSNAFPIPCCHFSLVKSTRSSGVIWPVISV